MTTASPLPRQPKSFRWKAIFAAVVIIINYASMIFVFHSSTYASMSSREHLSHLPPPPPITSNSANGLHLENNNDDILRSNLHKNDVSKKPPILLAGMAFSDTTISDAALNFLITAACSHDIHSHILLAKRDEDAPLDKKIKVLSAHMQPLPIDDGILRPIRSHAAPCSDFIHVDVSPGEEHLLNMTKSFHHNNLQLTDEDIPNNPWNEQNRIARIKRSREYQRQLVIQMLNNNQSSNKWAEWITSQEAVIGVLDLDLFSYPSVVDMIDSARDYIMVNNNDNNDGHSTDDEGKKKKKYHAICTNGLLVHNSRKYQGYRRRYYDTFSTILLPNSWLHVDRDKERGSLLGEDLTLAKMSQDETLQWILNQGRGPRTIIDNEQDKGRHDKDDEELVQQQHHQYEPVPVRSCFNGLTLYRADVWLQPKCRYDIYHKDDNAYLSKRYQHACEHIVFHECLRRIMMDGWRGEGDKNNKTDGREGFNIAVQPDLTTLWHYLS